MMADATTQSNAPVERMTVSASPLQTLGEQIVAGQQELLNQPGQAPPQPPRPLSVAERLNLAFAGLDPQFRRDVVQPEIDKRRGFVDQARAFEADQTAARQKVLAGALPAAQFEQKQIEDAQDQKKQADALREGYVGLAEDYSALVGDGESPGPMMGLITALRHTGDASNTVMADRLEADAALIELGIVKADAGVPQTPESLSRLVGKFKELNTLAGVATAALAGKEQRAQTEANIRGRSAAKIPPTVVKEAELWASIRDTAQLVLGRRDLSGDIGGPLMGNFSFMNDLQAAEEADLSIITGAIGRALGGGAALTPFEKSTLRGLYTQVTNTDTQKKARMKALIEFAQRKLDGTQKQYGDMGYGTGNPDEAEELRQQGGVLIGTSVDGSPRFQMPNGDVLEVSP